jgi:hypothetical protein
MKHEKIGTSAGDTGPGSLPCDGKDCAGAKLAEAAR